MASACTFPPGTSNESLSFVPTGGGSGTKMTSPPMLGARTREKSCRSPPCQATRMPFGNEMRRYLRISWPKGMRVAWHGGDLQLFSRVRTLSMGGLFISVPDPPPVGTKLRLAFEVPGGNVHAEAIVRNIVPSEGMGVEFSRLELKDRILLEKLLKRLLR